MRRITGEKRVGHAGTLDPLATGVLVVGIGRDATKRLGDIIGSEKEYIATVKLGKTSTTYDAEGEIVAGGSTIPTRGEVEKVLENFEGKITQVPPIYSAINVKGKRAYKLARAGIKVKMEPREVEVKKIEILKYEWPVLKLRAVTGSGFYVRSLAHDIGQKLGCGGYLLELKRTRVGNFDIEDTIKLAGLKTTS